MPVISIHDDIREARYIANMRQVIAMKDDRLTDAIATACIAETDRYLSPVTVDEVWRYADAIAESLDEDRDHLRSLQAAAQARKEAGGTVTVRI